MENDTFKACVSPNCKCAITLARRLRKLHRRGQKKAGEIIVAVAKALPMYGCSQEPEIAVCQEWDKQYATLSVSNLVNVKSALGFLCHDNQNPANYCGCVGLDCFDKGLIKNDHIQQLLAVKDPNKPDDYFTKTWEITPKGAMTNEMKDGMTTSNAFAYRATIINKGAKVVPIERIRLDYGANDDTNRRIKYVLEGKSNISPQEQKNISVTIKPSDIEEVKRKYDIAECHFYFYMKYQNSDGKTIETYRSLGGYTKDGVIFMARPGDALT